MIFLTRHLAILSIVTCMLFFVGAATVSAQFESFLNRSGTVTMNIFPEFPEENEEVRITLSSFVVDLDARRIIWKVDGSVVASEVGKKEHTIRAKPTGERTVVDVEIIEPTEILRIRRVINTGGLDILWEAPNTYTPPFYRGKALPSRESKIRATGIPRIPSFPTPESVSQYIFTWEQNRRVRGSESGYEKNVFEIINLLTAGSENIAVTIRGRDINFEANKNTDIVFVNPEVLFYVEDEDLGILPRALSGSIAVNTDGVKLIAEPYYFSPFNNNPRELDFVWRSGNDRLQARAGETLQQRVDIRSSTQGRTFINVEVDNLRTFLQSASNSIQVIFR